MTTTYVYVCACLNKSGNDKPAQKWIQCNLNRYANVGMVNI